MKKFANLFIIICVLLAFSSCTNDDIQTESTIETPAPTMTESITSPAAPTDKPSSTPTPTPEPFPGKIGFITETSNMDDFEYRATRDVVKKYSEEKIIHVEWPTVFIDFQDKITARLNKMFKDKDMKALITSGTPTEFSESLYELEDMMRDIFIINCNSTFAPIDMTEMAKQSDIVLAIDRLAIGSAMVQQAHALGAETFVHYYFSQLSYPVGVNSDCAMLEEECEKLGMKFVEVNLEDDDNNVYIDAASFLPEDVPKMVEKYGKNTAFFTTACYNQVTLIEAVMEAGAIYPSPCHPSPYHMLDQVFDFEPIFLDVFEGRKFIPYDELYGRITDALEKKNMLGRISTWPVDPGAMLTEASAEYAVKWLKGEVPKEGVDVDALTQLMTDYAGVQVHLTPYTDEETGETYDNYFLVHMDYITFE